MAELAEAQGKPVDIGGYYAADSDMTTSVTRPSKRSMRRWRPCKADADADM